MYDRDDADETYRRISVTNTLAAGRGRVEGARRLDGAVVVLLVWTLLAVAFTGVGTIAALARAAAVLAVFVAAPLVVATVLVRVVATTGWLLSEAVCWISIRLDGHLDRLPLRDALRE